MTERLYYTDSYLTQFSARVAEQSDDGRRVYLDRTAFYPTSGGQPHDVGTLSGIQVVDVVDEGERVAHVLTTPLPGSEIEGLVDWPRRFDHMQQHTGQHLLSAVLSELFAFHTVSVHFGVLTSTLDLDTGQISGDQVRQAEERANQIVTENRPVEVTFESADGAAGLRKTSERMGTLRIVSIADLDRSACGGTHVGRTGEIGALLIRRAERMKRQVRLEFLAGGRAIRRAHQDFELLHTMASEASAAPEELPASVQSLREQLKQASGTRRRLIEELSGYRARELVAAALPDGAGIRRILYQPDNGSMDEVRAVAQASITGDRVLLVGVTNDPPAIVVAASLDTGLDAAGLLRETLAQFGGKGGGTARLAQGGLPAGAPLANILAMLGVASSVT